MRFFDPEKWRIIRERGKWRLVRRVILIYFLGPGILLNGLAVWSFRSLYLHIGLPASALTPIIKLAIVFTFLVSPVVGLGAGLVSWHLTEWLYRRSLAHHG